MLCPALPGRAEMAWGKDGGYQPRLSSWDADLISPTPFAPIPPSSFSPSPLCLSLKQRNGDTSAEAKLFGVSKPHMFCPSTTHLCTLLVLLLGAHISLRKSPKMVNEGAGGGGGRKRGSAGRCRAAACGDEVTNSSTVPPSRMKPAGCSSALQLSPSPALPNTPCAGWLQQDTKAWMGKLGLRPAEAYWSFGFLVPRVPVNSAGNPTSTHIGCGGGSGHKDLRFASTGMGSFHQQSSCCTKPLCY